LFIVQSLLFFWWNGVYAAVAKRMAADNSFESQKTSLEKAVNFDCFVSVGGTAWLETAPRRHSLRDELITLNQKKRGMFHL